MRPPRLLIALLGMCLGAGATAGWTAPVSAEETRTVRSGIATWHIYPGLTQDLGLVLESTVETAPTPASMAFRMEPPHHTFAILPESDLAFRVRARIPVPYGIEGGNIRLSGSLTFRELRSGRRFEVIDPRLSFQENTTLWPKGTRPHDRLLVRDGVTGMAVFELKYSMFEYLPDTGTLQVHYLNLHVAPEWAEFLGRADLSDRCLGNIEVVAATERTSAEVDTEPAYVPNFVGGTLDVSLGRISGIDQAGREGTYPNGIAGLSMATTACNLGDVDVPWLAPMLEEHPTIAMALYRLRDGRLEQIGHSDMKHGFYALSSSDCTPCEHPSDGTFLGVGCSDTYGFYNNADRNYLAPRHEVNPFLGTWECTGSHFAGGEPDCQRRHGSGGHTPTEHRLRVRDADLGDPDATYVYESYYIVANDVDRHNNIGHRRCTMEWTGSAWDFSTPGSGNPLVEGAVIETWGDLRTTASIGPADGDLFLAVQTSDLGEGMFHYEYALFNFDSDLAVRSFSLPVAGVPGITNIGFRDSDVDDTNDWQVTLEDGVLTWQTGVFEEEGANPLLFGLMYNFRFDAAAPPVDATVDLEMYKPSIPQEMAVATLGPQASPSSVADGLRAARFHLLPAQPNPTTGAASFALRLDSDAPVRLELYDPQGRLVRTLANDRLAAGEHRFEWDGTDATGRPAASGVYYYRATAGGESRMRSVVLIR